MSIFQNYDYRPIERRRASIPHVACSLCNKPIVKDQEYTPLGSRPADGYAHLSCYVKASESQELEETK